MPAEAAPRAEAAERPHPHPAGRRVLALTSLGHFANDGAVFFVPVIVDLLAVTRHVGAPLITASLTLFYLSTALGGVGLGRLVDRRRLQVQGMVAGLLGLSAGLILFAVATDNVLVPFFLVVASVVTGLGASLYHPTGSSILQARYRGGNLGRYLGINGAAGSLGRAVYPTLLFLVALPFASQSLGVVFFAAVGIAVAAVIFAGLRGLPDLHPATATTPQTAGEDGRRGAAPRVVSGSIVLLAVISLLRSVAFFGILSWIPEYISFERGAGAGLSLGTIMTLMFAGGILGQLVFGKLVETHDKRLILVVNTLLSALLLFLYVVTSGFLSLAFLGLFGFINFSGFPIFMSMISDYVPRGSTTTANALVWNLGGTGGQAIGPLLVGVLYAGSYAHLSTVFEMVLGVAAVSALLALRLPRPVRVSPVPLFG